MNSETVATTPTKAASAAPGEKRPAEAELTNMDIDPIEATPKEADNTGGSEPSHATSRWRTPKARDPANESVGIDSSEEDEKDKKPKKEKVISISAVSAPLSKPQTTSKGKGSGERATTSSLITAAAQRRLNQQANKKKTGRGRGGR